MLVEFQTNLVKSSCLGYPMFFFVLFIKKKHAEKRILSSFLPKNITTLVKIGWTNIGVKCGGECKIFF